MRDRVGGEEECEGGSKSGCGLGFELRGEHGNVNGSLAVAERWAGVVGLYMLAVRPIHGAMPAGVLACRRAGKGSAR